MNQQLPEFSIESVDGVASLRLVGIAPEWPEYYWAELKDAGASCRARISAYDPRGVSGGKLSAVFREMADSWQGWKGARTWESPEGELRLAFSMSPTGGIMVQIVLRDPYRWTIHTSISTESGDTLSELAKRAEAFQMAMEGAA